MKTVICPECHAAIEEKLVIRKERLLIAEGKDDEQFFDALLRQLGLDEIQVLGIGGKTRLEGQLKALKLDPAWRQVSSIGIVRDADDDPDAAFRSVCSALKGAKLPVPSQALAPMVGPPTVQVMIIPALRKKGALEDLCLESAADDTAMPCVEQYFECLAERGAPGLKERSLSKAKTRVFLTSKEDPTLPLGIAAQKGYWPLDSSVFDEVGRFIASI